MGRPIVIDLERFQAYVREASDACVCVSLLPLKSNPPARMGKPQHDVSVGLCLIELGQRIVADGQTFAMSEIPFFQRLFAALEAATGVMCPFSSSEKKQLRGMFHTDIAKLPELVAAHPGYDRMEPLPYQVTARLVREITEWRRNHA